MREIKTGYHAWHFLREHPSFVIPERFPISGPPEEDKPRKSTLFTRTMESNPFYKPPKNVKALASDGTEVWYAEESHLDKAALDYNLDIHYTKVDETGVINDDDSKNIFHECWLEFGQIQWENEHNKEGREKYNDWTSIDYPESFTRLVQIHDWKLDVGAPTFDEALIQLANKVLELYGDYPLQDWL